MTNIVPEVIKDVLLFFLGLIVVRLYDWWKKNRRKNEIIDILTAELKVIQEAVSQSNKVTMEDFPFITDGYNSLRNEILLMNWKENTITMLHRTYNDIKKMNEPMGETDYGYTRSTGSTDYVYYQGLREIRNKIENLIAKLHANRIN